MHQNSQPNDRLKRNNMKTTTTAHARGMKQKQRKKTDETGGGKQQQNQTDKNPTYQTHLLLCPLNRRIGRLRPRPRRRRPRLGVLEHLLLEVLRRVVIGRDEARHAVRLLRVGHALVPEAGGEARAQLLEGGLYHGCVVDEGSGFPHEPGCRLSEKKKRTYVSIDRASQ